MSNPKPEHRISAVEKRVTHIEGEIEELAADAAEEFKALRQEMLQGFTQAHTYMQENIETVMATKEDISQLRNEMKAEMAAMESRIRQDVAALKDGLIEALKDLKRSSE